MLGYTDAPRAWGFTRGMARTMGASLTQAVVEGWLTRAELVEACRTCHATKTCTEFLSKTVSVPDQPAFCPNGAVLAALRP